MRTFLFQIAAALFATPCAVKHCVAAWIFSDLTRRVDWSLVAGCCRREGLRGGSWIDARVAFIKSGQRNVFVLAETRRLAADS